MPGRIGLFGGLLLERDGERRSLESGRAESLLAYLALHRGTAISRATLAYQLWPGTSEAQARTNLRKVLHLLRRAVPDVAEFLDPDGGHTPHAVPAYIPVPEAAAREAMLGAGMPEPMAVAFLTVFARQRAGAMTRVTDVVPRLTGRPARTVAEFARDHAGAFVPAPVQ